MKRGVVCGLAVSLFMIWGGMMNAVPPAAAADAVELRYSTFFGPTHGQAKLAEAWIKEVDLDRRELDLSTRTGDEPKRPPKGSRGKTQGRGKRGGKKRR